MADAQHFLELELADAPDHYWTQLSPIPTSMRAVGGMLLAMRRRADPEWSHIGDTAIGEAPRWESTISFLDNIAGGFYGLSTLGGPPNLGKTMLAMASAMEAAASLKWNVLWCNAEMAPDELSGRFDRYLDRHHAAEDAVPNLTIMHVPRGFCVEDLVAQAYSLAGDDRPLLTVLDSVNTCAELMNMGYLDALRELSLFAMMSRRISRGAASFLMVSELNRAGGVKGEKLSYWSDVFLKLAGDRKAGWVKIKLQKTRSTQGEGTEYKHVRVHHLHRFLRETEMDGQQLAVVGVRDDTEELDEF